MSFNFLSPVSERVLAHCELIHQQTLGRKMKIHSLEQGMPDLNGVRMAIIGVREHRNAKDFFGSDLHFDTIRTNFYSLYPGNWFTTIADLGDILPGDSVKDTYFALKTTIGALLEQDIIPIILGGSQDLTYANYRAYDDVLPMVNLVNIDAHFDLGDANLPITNTSYVGKIVVEEPYNLFNYSIIGYQTYFNSQEEIDLLEKLHFESYRLGEVSSDISKVEPLLRDAHIVSVDLKAIQASELDLHLKYSPNGFSGKEICAIARYAGISNKVSSFGIYEFKNAQDSTASEMLVAQMIWYFIEGVNCRVKDDDFNDDTYFQKYNVLVEEDEYVFYKSLKTGRWWMEIPFLPNVNNKLKKHTLLPCAYTDYTLANKGQLPERMYKAIRKNSF